MKDSSRVRDARLALAYTRAANLAVEAGKVYPDLYLPLEDNGMNPKVLALVLETGEDAERGDLQNGLEALIDARQFFEWMLNAVQPKEVIDA
jgi:hypothetical protein